MKKIKIFENESHNFQKVKLSDVKKGEYFKIKDTESAPVWVKGEFIRTDGLNKFSCTKYDDTNHEQFMAKDKEVYVGFEF